VIARPVCHQGSRKRSSAFRSAGELPSSRGKEHLLSHQIWVLWERTRAYDRGNTLKHAYHDLALDQWRYLHMSTGVLCHLVGCNILNNRLCLDAFGDLWVIHGQASLDNVRCNIRTLHAANRTFAFMGPSPIEYTSHWLVFILSGTGFRFFSPGRHDSRAAIPCNRVLIVLLALMTWIVSRCMTWQIPDISVCTNAGNEIGRKSRLIILAVNPEGIHRMTNPAGTGYISFTLSVQQCIKVHCRGSNRPIIPQVTVSSPA
jgi:hypothetical protein